MTSRVLFRGFLDQNIACDLPPPHISLDIKRKSNVLG